jgi:hypothetical protein
MIKKILYTLLGIGMAVAGTVYAVQTSVPTSGGSGFLLQSGSNGLYLPVSLTAGTNVTISTTTSNITISSSGSGGNSFAWPFDVVSAGKVSTTTTVYFLNGLLSTASTTINANATTTGSQYAGTLWGANLTTCNAVSGKITWANGAFGCGVDAGAGGGMTSFIAGLGLLGGTITDGQTVTAQVSTSSVPTVSSIAYWTSLGDTTNPAKLGSVATSSIASGVGITVTNGATAFVIGAQPSVACNTASATIFGCLTAAKFSQFDSATTTFTSPLTYTLGTNAVTCPTCSTFGYPFTVGTFVSTSTAIQFTSGLGSYSSTTINGLKLSDLSAGFAGIGGLGQVYSFATSTIKGSQITNDSAWISTVTADAPLSGSGTSGSHLVLSTAGTWSGNAVTASALAANGANCQSGFFPLGVDASGVSETCTSPFNFTVGTFVSTSTPIQFTAGLGSYSSTTINGLKLTDLSAGFVGVGGLGQVYSFATSTIKTSQLTNDAGFITVAGSAGYDFPNVQTNYNATSTTLGFLNGFFSTASSTVSGNFYLPALTQGYAFVGSAGKVSTISSSTLASDLTANCVTITGSASLCDGNDATGGAGGSSQWATTTLDLFGIIPAGAGYVGIGTSTPHFGFTLNLASSTRPQLALEDGTNPQWTFRNAGGNLYIGTSSPTTFATSSISAFRLDPNGQPYFSFLENCSSGIKSSAGGGLSCGTSGTTAWDSIGDPSGNGSIAMAETTQTLDWDTGAVSALADDYLTLTVTDDAAADISTQRLLTLANLTGSAQTVENLFRIRNDDALAVTTGMLIDGAGAFTTAIDVTDSDIVTALSAGANDLLGTNWSIAGASGLITSPYASSTIYASFINASSTNWLGGGLSSCTGSNQLQWSVGFFSCASVTVPSSADPNPASTGVLAINTTQASTSLRYFDGTAERALFDTFDKPTIYASSTLVYDGAYGATGTTTYSDIWNPSHAATLVSIYCKTDVSGSTAWYEVGTGSATSTVQCTSTGAVNSVTTVSFTLRQNVMEAVGRQSNAPNRITVTPTFRYQSD